MLVVLKLFLFSLLYDLLLPFLIDLFFLYGLAILVWIPWMLGHLLDERIPRAPGYPTLLCVLLILYFLHSAMTLHQIRPFLTVESDGKKKGDAGQ